MQNLEDSLTLIGIDIRDCQLRAVCDIVQDRLAVPQVDTVTQVIKMTVSRIKKINLDLVQSLLRPWIMAAEEGKRGESCEDVYRTCDDEFHDKKLELQISNW